MTEALYFVWRRSDGYVGCTRYEPSNGGTDADGSPTTFDLLLTCDRWDDARAEIIKRRAKG